MLLLVVAALDRVNYKSSGIHIIVTVLNGLESGERDERVV